MHIMKGFGRYFSAHLKQQIQQLEEIEWPSAQVDDESMYHICVLHKGAIIAHIGIDERFYLHYKTAGICSCIVHPLYRGQLISSILFREVHKYLYKMKVDFSIFTCVKELVPFYEKAGWIESPIEFIGGTSQFPISSKQENLHTMLLLVSYVAQQDKITFQQPSLQLQLGRNKMW